MIWKVVLINLYCLIYKEIMTTQCPSPLFSIQNGRCESNGDLPSCDRQCQERNCYENNRIFRTNESGTNWFCDPRTSAFVNLDGQGRFADTTNTPISFRETNSRTCNFSFIDVNSQQVTGTSNENCTQLSRNINFQRFRCDALRRVYERNEELDLNLERVPDLDCRVFTEN